MGNRHEDVSRCESRKSPHSVDRIQLLPGETVHDHPLGAEEFR